MNQFRSFIAICKARTLEFVRDRGAFFWNLLFPIFLIISFVALFGSIETAVFSVGSYGEIPEGFPLFELSGIEHIDYSERGVELSDATERVRKHQVDMLINFETGEYIINDQAANTELLRVFVTQTLYEVRETGGAEAATLASRYTLTETQVSGRAIRYTDWVIPGVIGMNMMFSCLFGVGFILIRYRKNGVLKRMKATPVTALSFLSAQVVSRFFIVLATSSIVFFGTNIFFNYVMEGSWLTLLLVTVLGITSLIVFGVLFAVRIKNEELGGNIINIAVWPMLLVSGVFFGLEAAPPVIQNISQIFPLTHFISAARAVMLDSATIIDILPNILYLSVFIVVTLILSSALFRWE